MQDARPVAGRFVGPGGPAVHEVQQHLLAIFDDRVVAASGNLTTAPIPQASCSHWGSYRPRALGTVGSHSGGT